MLAASTDDVRASRDLSPFAIIISNSPNSAASFAKLAAMDGSTVFGDAEGLGPARMLPMLIGETDDAEVELDRVLGRLDRSMVRLDGALVGRVRLLVELDRTLLELDGALVEPVRLLVELDRTLLELDDALVEPVVLLIELDRTLLELDELDGALVELTLLELLVSDGAARAGRTTRKRRQKSAMECILRFDVNEIITT